MNSKLTLYSRADCCLCDEMKNAVRQVAAKIPLDFEEIDVDGSAPLKEKYGAEVPVLFIDGRKAFKYRVTANQLEQRLARRRPWARFGLAKRGA
ncbi:MAG TPA: glutaredoxin family protein [Candidatus Binatia bacterium]